LHIDFLFLFLENLVQLYIFKLLISHDFYYDIVIWIVKLFNTSTSYFHENSIQSLRNYITMKATLR
jgi:hypothetical protein